MQSIKIVRSYWLKFRRWGWRGFQGWVRRQIEDLRQRRDFLRRSNDWKMKPTRGVTVIAELTGKSALSKTMRDFVKSLRECGIACQTYNLSRSVDIPEDDMSDVLTPLEDFHLRRYTSVVDMYASPYPRSSGLKHGRVAFWEAESGFVEVYPEVHRCGGLIGMSDFNVDYFRREFPKMPVWKILYPFRFAPRTVAERESVRRRYGLGVGDFVVFFNFDYASGFDRKNPIGVVEAFAKAFCGRIGTKLVFKTKSSKHYPDECARLRAAVREHGVAGQVVVEDGFIPEADLYGLTNACDVYLSMHRGEGFGLGIAEAMSLSKPVVVTDYSSTTEFCTQETSFPIPYKMVPLTDAQKKFAYFESVKEWADPDVDAAAEVLKRLYENADLRKRVGERAAKFMREYFSLENFKKTVDAFLDA